MKPEVNEDNVKKFVEMNNGVDMGDYFYVTWDNMVKLVNNAFTKGYEQALDDHDIIHGEDAKKFLEDMNRPSTPEEIKMFEDIEKKDLPNLF